MTKGPENIIFEPKEADPEADPKVEISDKEVDRVLKLAAALRRTAMGGDAQFIEQLQNPTVEEVVRILKRNGIAQCQLNGTDYTVDIKQSPSRVQKRYETGLEEAGIVVEEADEEFIRQVIEAAKPLQLVISIYRDYSRAITSPQN